MCLGHMIEELHTVDTDTLTDAEVSDRVLGLRRLIEAAQAEELRAVGAFEARKLHKTDGAYSTGAWLRAHTDLASHEANSLERHARTIRTRPLLGLALDTLGATKLRTMLRYVTFRLGDAYAEAEPVLVEQITKLSTDETATVMRWWARRVDQDGREPKSWDHNEIDLKDTYQGGWHLRGGFDPETGAELAAALDAEAEAIYRAGGTTGENLTLGRRRAMALMEIIRRHLDPAHTDTQIPPTVMVSVTLDELLKRSGHGDLIGTHEKITSDTIRRLACDANLIRIVTDGASEILDLGRSVRTAPPRYKRALAVRDKGCVFPGCDRPPSHCRAHHIQWWDRDGGETSLQNLALLCHHHHHLVHEGRWKLTRAPDGQLQFHRPDGTPFQLRRSGV
jgi:hypothetical protein